MDLNDPKFKKLRSEWDVPAWAKDYLREEEKRRPLPVSPSPQGAQRIRGAKLDLLVIDDVPVSVPVPPIDFTVQADGTILVHRHADESDAAFRERVKQLTAPPMQCNQPVPTPVGVEGPVPCRRFRGHTGVHSEIADTLMTRDPEHRYSPDWFKQVTCDTEPACGGCDRCLLAQAVHAGVPHDDPQVTELEDNFDRAHRDKQDQVFHSMMKSRFRHLREEASEVPEFDGKQLSTLEDEKLAQVLRRMRE